MHALSLGFRDETLRKELKRGGVDSAEDIISYLLLTPEEIPAFTAGSELNTDDDAIIEFGAPRDLLGSTRTADPYLARVYASEWPYGRFDRHLVGLGEGDERWKTELRLARSLLAHGKRAAADRFLAAAQAATARRPTRARRSWPTSSARRTPTTARSRSPPAEDDPLRARARSTRRSCRTRCSATTSTSSATCGRAPGRTRSWRCASLARELHRAGRRAICSSCVGFLMYKADLDDVACDRLKPLVDDQAYAARRPSTYYYLARAEYGNGLFDAAVRNMDRYLDATGSPPAMTAPAAAATAAAPPARPAP